MRMCTHRSKLRRGLLLLATSALLLQAAGPCDTDVVRSAFLGSAQQFVTSIIGAFFQSLERDRYFAPVTVSAAPAGPRVG